MLMTLIEKYICHQHYSKFYMSAKLYLVLKKFRTYLIYYMIVCIPSRFLFNS